MIEVSQRERKSIALSVRVSASQAARLRQLALRDDVAVSQIARQALLAGLAQMAQQASAPAQ